MTAAAPVPTASPAALPIDQLDAWVLSTYQRLERMDAPVFAVDGGAAIEPATRAVRDAAIRLLPTALPHEIGSLRDWLSGADLAPTMGAPERLSLLFRYLAGALRYEPMSENAMHKAVPSARGLFPIDYYLLRRGEAGMEAFRYVPEFHALERIDLAPSAALGAVRNAAVVAVARVWRTAEKYGEFADLPPTLEAGHAFAQLGLLADALGMAVDAGVDREVGRGLCMSALDLPLFALALDATGFDPAACPRRLVKLGVTVEKSGLLDRFARLPALHGLFDGAGATAAEPRRPMPAAPTTPTSDAGMDAGLLATLRRRSAGNDRSGTAAALIETPATLLPDLLNRWARIAARRSRLVSEEQLRHAVAWTGRGPVPADLYGADGRGRGVQALAPRLARMLPYGGMRFNPSTLVATLIVAADPVNAIERHGAAALREIHLAAGAVAQDFSIAATSLGLFVRPVRMMREAQIEQALPIEGTVVYLVLAGFARRANLTMELM